MSVDTAVHYAMD